MAFAEGLDQLLDCFRVVFFYSGKNFGQVRIAGWDLRALPVLGLGEELWSWLKLRLIEVG